MQQVPQHILNTLEEIIGDLLDLTYANVDISWMDRKQQSRIKRNVRTVEECFNIKAKRA